jgi:hypothetical protein
MNLAEVSAAFKIKCGSCCPLEPSKSKSKNLWLPFRSPLTASHSVRIGGYTTAITAHGRSTAPDAAIMNAHSRMSLGGHNANSQVKAA